MTRLISAPTRLEAWLQASEHLLGSTHDLNLILSIEAPGSSNSAVREIHTRLDEFYSAEGVDPLHTVAETIFPGWAYRHRGLKAASNVYASEYDLLKRGEPLRWGTYADRILRRKLPTGEIVSPLEILIEKMKSELQQERRGPFRACYEIDIAEADTDIPIYDAVRDQRRRRGGMPCLSHLSFKLYDGSVHLTALYRSHEYRYKVPGNLLGLARLQACVANEVGVEMGTLVVHSTYAFIDVARGKAAFSNLVAELRELASTMSET